MTTCDNCGRATQAFRATTFPDRDIVICNRSRCEPVGDEAMLRYCEDDIEEIREVVL